MGEGPNIKGAPDALTPEYASRVIEWLDARRPLEPIAEGELADIFKLDDMTVVWIGETRDER